MGKSQEDECCGCTRTMCGAIWLGIGFLLFVILLPLSFARVDYWQYGFVMNNIAGTIDRSEVYTTGLYVIGPAHSFVGYESVVQDVILDDLPVWSRADSGSGDAGTSLRIDCALQYFLNKDSLASLYEKVGFNEKDFLRNVAIDVIKNNATRFGADTYLQNRLMIEEQFTIALEAQLKAVADATVENFQLKHVSFPESFYERKLTAAIQAKRNTLEEYNQRAALIRGNTSIMVNQIENDATEVLEAAKTNGDLLKKQASNEAIRTIEDARRDGLQIVAEILEMNSEKELLSLSYLIKLEDNTQGTEKFVNFEQFPEAKSLLN